jgi:SLOG in TRPM, prokaryote/Protein of unknown function (DUF4231)
MDQPPPASTRAVALRVIHSSSPDELADQLTGVDLSAPRPVVVLVGGADMVGDPQLARLRPLFDEGLAPLADALGACVIDGGTDAGVMALIGQARAKLGASFPLIGVAASGTVEQAGSASEASDVSAPEPNHTHLVLVPGASWGSEAPWLAEIASFIARDGPSVTIVVNGGEVTYQDAERSVAAGRPVLVVAGSGRAADAMAAALHGPSQDERAAKLAASGLVQAVDLGDGPHALARAVASLLTIAPVRRPPASKGYQDWLKADFEGLISELQLPELRRHFLQSRWLEQLLWVEGRANHSRNRYYLWRLITIIGGVLVPALVTLQLNRPPDAPLTWATFAVSLLVAVSAAVEGFFRYGERWRHYRRTAELLKTEGWQFFQLTGHYRRHAAHASAYPTFASRIEDILQHDVDAYITTVAAEPTEKQPNNPERPAPM